MLRALIITTAVLAAAGFRDFRKNHTNGATARLAVHCGPDTLNNVANTSDDLWNLYANETLGGAASASWLSQNSHAGPGADDGSNAERVKFGATTAGQESSIYEASNYYHAECDNPDGCTASIYVLGDDHATGALDVCVFGAQQFDCLDCHYTNSAWTRCSVHTTSPGTVWAGHGSGIIIGNITRCNAGYVEDGSQISLGYCNWPGDVNETDRPEQTVWLTDVQIEPSARATSFCPIPDGHTREPSLAVCP